MAVRQIEPIDRAELRATIQKWIDAHTDVDDTDGVGLLEDVLWEINAQPTLTPPNELLTLDQLREMDGEPVYIPEIECWALVKREQFTLLLTFSDGKQCPASEWYEQVGPVFSRPPGGRGGHMKITQCPQCGGNVISESVGWRCESCQGFIDMQGGFHPHKEEPFMPPMTYADRIRASSDEQLALFFKELMFNDFKPACKKSTFFSAEHKPECEEDCVSCILKLLQQPAEEDT